MAYTKAEAVEEIYNAFEPHYTVPQGAPEDFVEWAIRQDIPLDAGVVGMFEFSADGVYDSLEAYADDMFPGMGWEALVEDGYWQGDYSDMVFRPLVESVR
jgi:hypothetical protein